MLDQWTKGVVETALPVGGVHVPLAAVEPWFKIVHLTNTGAAFGLFQGQSGFFVVVAMVVILAIVGFTRYLPVGSLPARVCTGLMLGGAVGNLVDRLQHGGQVTDYLLFSLPMRGRVLHWPAFNVADAALVVGAIGLAILLLLCERDATKGEQAPA
jgi:signal peptidase II